jgi:ribosomal protein S30
MHMTPDPTGSELMQQLTQTPLFPKPHRRRQTMHGNRRCIQRIFTSMLLALSIIGSIAIGPHTAQAQGAVNLVLTPATPTVNAGDAFAVTLEAQAGAQPVALAEVYLNFDPALLQVTSLTAGTVLPAFTGLDPNPTTFDNTLGQIKHIAGTLGTAPSGTFTLLTINFTALPGVSGVSPLSFSSTFPRATLVSTSGLNLTGTTVAGSITVQNLAAAATCSPISTLECSAVPVALPFNLTWAASEGGLNANGGVGTGFTMVDPPSARLAADNPVSNAAVPGYEPSKLTVAGGTLTIASTKGIMFKTPVAGPNNSANTNSQLNALGVGIDGDATTFRIETVLDPPTFAGSSGAEQGGIWFGLNEDNYTKLVLSYLGSGNVRVQLLREIAAAAGTTDEINSNAAPLNLTISQASVSTIRLIMDLNPTTNTVAASFAINGGAVTNLGSFTIPASFFAGVNHDSDGNTAPVSYAGLFATNRNGSTSYNFAFDSFSIVSTGNNAPVATGQSVTTDEDTAKAITLAATDADSDPLVYTVVDQPTHGSLTITGPNVNYTPDANYNGPDSFTFKANDGTVDSNTATVNITVSAVNDAPVAAAQSVTTDEDTAKAITLAATDIDGNTLVYSVVDQPTHGSLTITGPNVTYTPDANYNGPDSFTFKANDGTVDSNTATVNITVSAVNDAPVAAAQSVTTDEDTAKAITLAATDIDGNTLVYTVVDQPTHGSLTITGPNVTYTPDAGYNGPDSFTFKANDGTVDSNTATVDITVNAVNDLPVATDQSVSTDEDTAKAITLAATDGDGDPLVYTVVDQPTHGSLTITGPNVTYTPDAGYNGPDSFTFKANDGTVDSNTATVDITVGGTNDAPVATGQSVSTDEDTAKAITLAATDADSDPLVYTVVDQPTHGSLTITGPNVNYTPDANYNGPDSFTFKVNDGTVDSNTATVNITVNAVNDTPVATGQSVTTDEDTAKSITLAATDIDGDTLVYSVVDQPTHGSLTITGPNVTYTPDAGYNGPDSFTFKAFDGTVDSNTATVNITVNALVTFDTSLTLEPSQTPLAVGETFEIEIIARTGTQPINGAAVFVDYDPTKLEVLAITPGTTLEQPLINDFATAGQIDYAAGTLNGTVTGDVLIATVTLKALVATPSTELSFQRTDPLRTTDLQLVGSVLGSAPATTVTILTTEVNGSVTLQGRPAKPHPSWIVPLTIAFYRTGETVPAYEFTPTTDNNGQFVVSGFLPGTYSVLVKNSHTLSNLRQITIVAGPNQLDLGTLREGDVNDDNEINLADFSALVPTFGKAVGAVGYDSRADFNHDGNVTIADFSLLSANYGLIGDNLNTVVVAAAEVDLAPATATLSLSPERTVVSAGEEFEVQLLVSGNGSLEAVAALVSFDPAILEAVGVVAGSDLPIELVNSLDNTQGLIHYEAGSLGSVNATSDLVVATLRFRARAASADATLTLTAEGENASGVYKTGVNILSTADGATVVIDATAPTGGSGNHHIFLPAIQ